MTGDKGPIAGKERWSSNSSDGMNMKGKRPKKR